VSFTHIVKAMEPFFSALVAAVCFRQIFKPQVRPLMTRWRILRIEMPYINHTLMLILMI
jgi:hypothetical protein